MGRQPSSVRERLWLLAHDEYNDMRPRINVRALDIGLAAATLVDLLLWEHIKVAGGLIYGNAGNRGAVGGTFWASSSGGHRLGWRRFCTRPVPSRSAARRAHFKTSTSALARCWLPAAI